MASGRSIDKSSEDSTSGETCDIDTPGPSSISTASEIKAQKDFFVHKLAKHDTLAGLAIRYGVSVYDLKKANGLTSEWSMFGRDSLIIPLHPMSENNEGDDLKSVEEFVGSIGQSSLRDDLSAFGRASTSRPPSTTRVQKMLTVSGGTERSLSYLVDNTAVSSSEIELEVLHEEPGLYREELYRRRKRDDQSWSSATLTTSLMDPSSSTRTGERMQRTTVTDSSDSSFTDYFSSLARSLMQQSESFFGLHAKSTSSGTTKSVYERMKKMALSYKSNSDSQVQATSRNKSSPDPNSNNVKELFKVD